MSILAGLALWTLTAFAGDYYFEGPVHTARGDAVATSRTAREGGHDARVVRRYRDGTGWEYLVRVSGFSDESSALAAASFVAQALGEGVSLFSQQSDGDEPTAVALPASGRHTAEREAEAEAETEPSALTPSIEAHGGVGGGAAKIHAAETVIFKFKRTLPDGSVIQHTWARSGGDTYTAIERVAGDVKPSRTLVRAEGAWLSVDSAPFKPQDRERTLETLADLAPERVIPFVLSFATLSDERKELQSIREEGLGEVEGSPVRILHSDGDRASGPLVIEVDKKTALIRRVGFNDGAMVVQFDRWDAHPKAAVRIPGQVRTWREGKLVDTVEILEVSLDVPLPEEWLKAP